MKKMLPAVFFLVFLSTASSAVSASPIVFKEQYYRLFRMRLDRSPDLFLENIFWLERALEAPFANPLFALAVIENELQWEKYRHLFRMHINLLIVRQYLNLGSLWNKREAFFFNAPFRDQNLESLETAEALFTAALFYWEEAVSWAELANDRRFRFVNLQRVQYWEDQALRIERGTLDFGRTIRRELASLERVREQFQAMDTHFYVRTAPPDFP